MEDRIKKYNCYGCGIHLTQEDSIRAPKSEEGEILIWCAPCKRNQIKKRRKLIKRKLPHYVQLNSATGRQ